MRIFHHKRRYIDMTSGSPIRAVFIFSLPLIFGNLFQQLYSFADAAIVGRFVGVNAFAAIGSTGWIVWWLNTISRDCSNAFCIAASIRIGSQNTEEFRRFIALSIVCGTVLSIAVASAILLGVDPLLHLLRVAPEIYTDARTYFIILTFCLPVSMAFHITCALLRAAGNGSITFTAMTVSTLMNIILDVVFVVVLDWGVAGAGVATLLSQIISMLIALSSARQNQLFTLSQHHFYGNRSLFGEAVRLWLPIMSNSLLITFGGVFVQNFINALGTHFTAGIEVGNKLYNLFESVILALQMGACVFVGQNLGANFPERIRSGMRRIIGFAMLITFAMIVIVWIYGSSMVGWFLSRSDEALFIASHRVGVRYANVLVTAMLVMTPMYICRVSLQALGHPNYTMISGILQLFARLITVLVMTRLFGPEAVYFTEAAAWLAALPVVAFPFFIYLNRLCTSDLPPQQT